MFGILKKYQKENAQNLLIIGAPKSGTTALLYKLKNALETGRSVKEYFEPEQLGVINSAIKKHKKSVTKVVAIRAIHPEDTTNFSKIILIPRDPRDQFVSSMLYEAAFHSLWDENETTIKEFYQALCRKAENPKESNCIDLWNTYVSKTLSLDEFVNRNEYLRKFHLETESLVLKYEDFVADKFDGIEKALEVQLNVEGEIPSTFKRVIRTKGSGSWKDWLTQSDLEFFKVKFSDYYHDFGYDEIEWQLDHNSIEKKYASDYFLKTINSKRVGMGLEAIEI